MVIGQASNEGRNQIINALESVSDVNQKDENQLELVNTNDADANAQGLEAMTDALRQPDVLSVRFVKPTNVLVQRNWPQTNLKIIDLGPQSTILLKEEVPQFKDHVDDVDGYIRNYNIASTKMALRLMSIWDINKPFTFVNPKTHIQENVTLEEKCLEGLNILTLVSKANRPENIEDRNTLVGLNEGCVVRTPQQGAYAPLTDVRECTFVDGSIRHTALSAASEIYRRKFRSVAVEYEERKATLPPTWAICEPTFLQRNAVFFNEPIEQVDHVQLKLWEALLLQ